MNKEGCHTSDKHIKWRGKTSDKLTSRDPILPIPSMLYQNLRRQEGPVTANLGVFRIAELGLGKPSVLMYM